MVEISAALAPQNLTIIYTTSILKWLKTLENHLGSPSARIQTQWGQT